MNKIFKKSRSVSPSFEIPKICLPRQKKSIEDALDNEKELPSTLKVPSAEPRIRSSSFDSSTLKQDSLEVPNKQGRRCHSFDSACAEQISHGSSEESICDSKESIFVNFKVPNFKRKSSFEIPRLCIHCIHMETKAKEMCNSQNSVDRSYPRQFLFEDDFDRSSDDFSNSSSTSYTTTSSESLSDQGDFYYLTNSEDEGNESDCDDDYDDNDNDKHNNEIPRLEHFDSKEDEMYVNAVTLAVPVIKQHRSSSMDERILKGPECQIQRQASFDEGCLLDVPIQVRSSSVDVNLPTEQETSYRAIPHSDSRYEFQCCLFFFIGSTC